MVTKYNYTFGAGSEPNRCIIFTRSDENDAGSIQAEVFTTAEGNSISISKLSGSAINVEMMTNSDKIMGFQKRRRGEMVTFIPDKKLSELTKDKQQEILKNLQPKGGWRIEVTNNIGQKDPRFEQVVHLALFNPT